MAAACRSAVVACARSASRPLQVAQASRHFCHRVTISMTRRNSQRRQCFDRRAIQYYDEGYYFSKNHHGLQLLAPLHLGLHRIPPTIISTCIALLPSRPKYIDDDMLHPIPLSTFALSIFFIASGRAHGSRWLVRQTPPLFIERARRVLMIALPEKQSGALTGRGRRWF